MKKLFAALLALTLALCAAGAQASGLEPYNPGKISGIDVAPVGDIGVNLGGYETHEIEDVDVAPVGDIGVNLGEYETHEIENVDVAPLEPIRVDLGEYPTREIEALEVKPLEEIQVELAEYDVPDISGVAPVELQPFYLGLVGYLGDAQRQALSGLSEIEAADLVQRQHDLIDDINAAFLDAGITASVDPISGSVPINATLLYATDAYEVTDAGKQVLASVFRVYCDVLSREAYRDFISNVVIVGHTDTDGSYDYNVTLSQKRAEAVKAFCLSPECGVGDPDWLSSRLIAEGHSYDELIYNSDGTENKAASRRVEIGFNIAIG